MSRSKVEGTKIAQAAKDLNVTSVTIRRYIQEFEIETATDENGIKVLPAQALEELQEIRKLKEDGLTNPKVMEQLEEMRSNKTEEKPSKAKARGKATKVVASKAKKAVVEVDDDEAEAEEEEVEVKPEPVRKVRATKVLKAHPKEAVEEKEKDEDESSADGDAGEEQSSARRKAMARSSCMLSPARLAPKHSNTTTLA
jgi:DNA-binding transcriptional MerR regulator